MQLPDSNTPTGIQALEPAMNVAAIQRAIRTDDGLRVAREPSSMKWMWVREAHEPGSRVINGWEKVRDCDTGEVAMLNLLNKGEIVCRMNHGWAIACVD